MIWSGFLRDLPANADTVREVVPWAGGAAIAVAFWRYLAAVMRHALEQAERWPTLVDAMQERLNSANAICEERLEDQREHYDRQLADLREQVAYLRAEVERFRPPRR